MFLPAMHKGGDYLATGESTDAYTGRLQGEVIRARNDDEWRENYMTIEMKPDQKYEEGLSQGRISMLFCVAKKTFESL